MGKKKIAEFDREAVKKTTHIVLLDTDDGDSTFTTKGMTIDVFQRKVVEAKTVNYTAKDSDEIITSDATAGQVTITLPTASGRKGKKFVIKRIDASANDTIIDGAGAETIDGVATKTLSSQFDSLTIVSDGTNWIVV